MREIWAFQLQVLFKSYGGGWDLRLRVRRAVRCTSAAARAVRLSEPRAHSLRRGRGLELGLE